MTVGRSKNSAALRKNWIDTRASLSKEAYNWQWVIAFQRGFHCQKLHIIDSSYVTKN